MKSFYILITYKKLILNTFFINTLINLKKLIKHFNEFRYFIFYILIKV